MKAELARFLSPRGVAVVGASNDFSRIGGQPIRMLTEFGYKGNVYPVNPKYTEIAGLQCYPSLSGVPKPCDVALVAVAAQHVPGVIEECGRVGIPYALVLSAGFSEVGGEGTSLQAKLVDAVKKSGVRVNGPNCLGIFNLNDGVRTGFGGTLMLDTLKPGPIAMVTQSGGFGFGVVAVAAHYGVGINYGISTGNEADLTALDWLESVIELPDVEVAIAFLEGISDGRRLIAIGERALELGKPILVWKVGNTDVGRQAAASHTARLTAGYELYRTAFRLGGFIEVRDIDDLVDVCKALRHRKLPRGNRVAVITPSGGAGVLLADRCVEEGLQLPPLAEETLKKLREYMAAFATVANPVDATPQGYNDNYASYNRVIGDVLADPNIDSVIARCPRGSAAKIWAKNFVEMLRAHDKPVLINWPTSPDDNADVVEYLEANNVPVIMAPGRTAHALGAINDYAQKVRRYQSRRGRSTKRPTERRTLDIDGATGTLSEHRSKALLATYGIPTVKEVLLGLDDIESLTDASAPFPVAVKISSADIPHKTEAGAIALDVRDIEGLKRAARTVTEAARRYKPDARIEGVLVQQMASGLETIAGAVNDRFFGPVVAFGLGGVFTELLKDVTYRFAPFDVETAKEMIGELKGAAALLAGYRGSAALDVDALADALSRLSLLVADHAGEIAEIDVNPLFVRPKGGGVIAADALVVIKDVRQ
jgi:acyl-CoA synthetase (NDP forming)